VWAKRTNDGINSFWHNDHVWVWFRNAGTWEPFDSSLAVCGFDQFYRKRFFKHKELNQGFVQKWTGPPFVIWEDVGDGFSDMKNITSTIVNSESMMPLKCRDEWQELVDTFMYCQQEDFNKTYLPEHLIRKIKAMSVQWFTK
jgi:hypothetical protein